MHKVFKGHLLKKTMVKNTLKVNKKTNLSGGELHGRIKQ
jgi:hypothetical protein